MAILRKRKKHYDDEIVLVVPRWSLPEISAGLRIRAEFHGVHHTRVLVARKLKELAERIEK
jgi:hypothetical protein